MLRLLEPNNLRQRTMKDLKDGQIAVVTGGQNGEYKGRVVQRFGGKVVTLGAESGCSWSVLPSIPVEILPLGSTFTLEEN